MALTADFQNLIIHSDSSITDVVAFHLALRDMEDDPYAMCFPVIHTYKEINLDGAVFPAVEFVNGWTLQFPAGNWAVRGGNVKAIINPVANCYVQVTQSAAYAVTAVGGNSYTPADIATAVWEHTTALNLLDKVTLAEAILRNKVVTDPVTGLMTIYKADSITPYMTAQLFENITTTQQYRGQGIEVRNKLEVL